ncbi:hypothetical protein [Fuchsiella alkaliacetigena]|uniref:hypothetical protein n=1 Tax=Fuchsiella alkaliacetigena TaxID=957042 RepID=UPI002009E14D|nr:hypothetical protein [Fuchsiella alkaliacetigena]MCK8824225.1 hypothetical protein [Fuchsiella alkaliacetigena]
MIILLVISLALIIAIDLRHLLAATKKDIFIYSALLVAAFMVALAQLMEWKLLVPSRVIESLVRSIIGGMG